jgi:hypothetical protein
VGRRAIATAAFGLVALVVSHACGGSSFVEGDAGADASLDAAADAAMCIVPPNGVGNERDFCNLEAQVFSTCGECEACRQLDENACVGLGDALSIGFKSALTACQSTLGCDDITTYGQNPCIRGKLTAAPPDPAQVAAKNAYCTACPNNHFECANYFNLAPDAGAGSGFGIWALTMSDSLTLQIAQTCSGSNPPHCDAAGYLICGALLFCGTAPHTNCTKGLCK